MSLNTQNIGKTMPHGFAGSYAKQPDMIINTIPAGVTGTDTIKFGTPLKLSSGRVVALGASSTAGEFIGIAGAELKSALSYTNQSEGVYGVNDPVAVFQRGSINVICQRGTPALGGAVYVRITANSSYSTAVVGGFEAEADGDKTIQLPNCNWQGGKDSNNVAELRILSMATGYNQAAKVAAAAGTAPTKAEFDALINSLVAAGIMKSS